VCLLRDMKYIVNFDLYVAKKQYQGNKVAGLRAVI